MEQRKVILYISMSLDGYLADEAGGVGWLAGESSEYTGDYGYQELLNEVDTVVMGNRTYQQIITELSPEEWVYPTLTSYVITHEPQEESESIRFVSENPEKLLRQLKQEEGKSIWLCGGAGVIKQALQADMVDEYRIAIMPLLLGGGVRLFADGFSSLPLHLVSTTVENGVISCRYLRKNS